MLDFINKICQEKNSENNEYVYEKNSNANKLNMDLLEKLYFLSEYKHEQCGFIFRNSIKDSYLHHDILKLKRDHPSQRQKRSASELNTKHHRFQQHRKHFLDDQLVIQALNSNVDNSNNYSALNKFAPKFDKRYSAKKYTTLIKLKPKYSAVTYKMKHSIINLTTSSKSSSPDNADSLFKINLNTSTKNTTINPISAAHPSIKYNLSNCSLLLLNIYLLAFKSNCDYVDFTESLASYDCESNNFSVKSDCNSCKVSVTLNKNCFIKIFAKLWTVNYISLMRNIDSRY